MESVPIFIIGFTGVGKTTFGQKLADSLAVPFVDLDTLIAQTEEESITSIFETKGEKHFREIEAECLRILPLYPSVIATGGGTPCFHDNMVWMKSSGKVIYLKAAKELILAHLQTSDLADRPLLRGKSTQALKEWIYTTLSEREGYYLQADEIIDVSD